MDAYPDSSHSRGMPISWGGYPVMSPEGTGCPMAPIARRGRPPSGGT